MKQNYTNRQTTVVKDFEKKSFWKDKIYRTVERLNDWEDKNNIFYRTVKVFGNLFLTLFVTDAVKWKTFKARKYEIYFWVFEWQTEPLSKIWVNEYSKRKRNLKFKAFLFMKINYRIRLFAREWKNVNNIVMMVILLIVQIVQ